MTYKEEKRVCGPSSGLRARAVIAIVVYDVALSL